MLVMTPSLSKNINWHRSVEASQIFVRLLVQQKPATEISIFHNNRAVDKFYNTQPAKKKSKE